MKCGGSQFSYAVITLLHTNHFKDLVQKEQDTSLCMSVLNCSIQCVSKPLSLPALMWLLQSF